MVQVREGTYRRTVALGEHRGWLGPMRLSTDGHGISEAAFVAEGHTLREPPGPDHPLLEQAAAELAAYFDGERTAFEVPLTPKGTEFQQQVWAALREIPFGATWSYGALAQRVGRPKAARAVGAANGANPCAVLIPCHRVIGANGKLTGYRGGVPIKRWLLDHEDPQGRLCP